MIEHIEYNIKPTTKEEIHAVLDMIKSVPDALLEVDEEEIMSWINQGHSLVAKTTPGEIIGHQAAGIWPGCGWIEVRAAIVKPEYRGKGINTKMKKAMIEKIKAEKPEATLVGFTEAASLSRGILQRMGFMEIPLKKTPAEFFSICPENCIMKTGQDCGCKVFVLDTGSESNNG